VTGELKQMHPFLRGENNIIASYLYFIQHNNFINI